MSINLLRLDDVAIDDQRLYGSYGILEKQHYLQRGFDHLCKMLTFFSILPCPEDELIIKKQLSMFRAPYRYMYDSTYAWRLSRNIKCKFKCVTSSFFSFLILIISFEKYHLFLLGRTLSVTCIALISCGTFIWAGR